MRSWHVCGVRFEGEMSGKRNAIDGSAFRKMVCTEYRKGVTRGTSLVTNIIDKELVNNN